MNFEKKPSFERSWKKLSSVRQTKAKEALERLVLFFEEGVKPEGLGLKKLQHSFWEIRTDLKDRILFLVEANQVSFVLIGNHDEIHRHLRRQ